MAGKITKQELETNLVSELEAKAEASDVTTLEGDVAAHLADTAPHSNATIFLKTDGSLPLTGNLTLSGSDRLIKKSSNTGRLLLAGGISASFNQGAYFVLEGIDYGGSGAGGNATIITSSSGTLRISRFGSTIHYIVGLEGNPEGVVTAPPGSLYLRPGGGTGTTLYVKETGTGNTGWVAK